MASVYLVSNRIANMVKVFEMVKKPSIFVEKNCDMNTTDYDIHKIRQEQLSLSRRITRIENMIHAIRPTRLIYVLGFLSGFLLNYLLRHLL